MARCVDLILQDSGDLLIKTQRFTIVSKRLPANFVLDNPPKPSTFIRYGISVFNDLFANISSAVVVEQAHQIYYLPFDEARDLIAKMALGYNIDAMENSQLLRVTIEGNHSLTVQLRREGAEKFFHQRLTISGIEVTACNEEWIDVKDDCFRGPKNISLRSEDKAEIPNGYVKVERLGMPPLYIKHEDSEKIVQRITQNNPISFMG